jgi:hypothetical protein
VRISERVVKRYTGRTTSTAHFRCSTFIHLRLLWRHPFAPALWKVISGAVKVYFSRVVSCE